MSINTYGVNTLVERLDARRWNTLESGGDSLDASFICKSAYVHTFRTQLVTSGHPSFPALRTKYEDVSASESYTGLATITAKFSGSRTAATYGNSTAAAGRISRCRPINPVQAEYEIRTLQNYWPKIGSAYSLLLDEIPPETVTYPVTIGGVKCSESYLIYPVLESYEATQIAEGLYDCTYYVTTRECMNKLSGFECKTGYTLNPDNGTHTYNETGAGSGVVSYYRDNSVYFSNLPTDRISLSTDLQLGTGLDKLATQRGKNIRNQYARFRGTGDTITTNPGAGSLVKLAYIQVEFFKHPPRILTLATIDE